MPTGRQGRMQPLGDGWVGRFDYAVTRRGWVPVSLHVWHDSDGDVPASGLPVRRLRMLTASDDLAAFEAPPRQGVVAPVVQLTAEQRRTEAGRMSALMGYDSLRWAGRTRAQTAAAMSVSEPWLKWVLSWGRQNGYLTAQGDLTQDFVLAWTRLTNEGA